MSEINVCLLAMKRLQMMWGIIIVLIGLIVLVATGILRKIVALQFFLYLVFGMNFTDLKLSQLI